MTKRPKHTLASDPNQHGLACHRAHAESAAQHRAIVERLRRHPLAMHPDIVRFICARSLAALKPSIATIQRFCVAQPKSEQSPPPPPPSPEGCLEKAALEYLRTPSAPNGYAKHLALRHGVNYGSLLTKISVLRQRHRFV